MAQIIPKTYNEIKLLVGLRQLRTYSPISNDWAETIYNGLLSGEMESVTAVRENRLQINYTDGREPTIIDTLVRNNNIDAVMLYRNSFRVLYSSAYLAAQRSYSGSDSGGGSSNNNNNNNNNNH